MKRLLSPTLAAAFTLAWTSSLSAQLLSQSDLTLDDVDPGFQLTLDHLAEDSRWLGLAPRGVTWAPDGQSVYFQWREDPAPRQNGATDPWYVANRRGTEVRQLDAAEVASIPTDMVWSADRKRAAWAREGTLFVWDERDGTRSPYTAVRNLNNLHLSADGSRVFFSTRPNDENGDLWALDIDEGVVRQIAHAVEKTEADTTEAGKWLAGQQLELVEIVGKRKRDREVADSVRRSLAASHIQRIPVEKGATASRLQLTPDGRFLTFRWEKEPAKEQRTQYLEFVNESGYATPRNARPKVGEPQSTFKMGIVKVDSSVMPDSVDVIWVDDGQEDRESIVHGPYWSPTGETAVVQILSIDHKDRWLSFLDVETGETSVIDHQHDDAWIGGPLVNGRWQPGYLQWLPDGSAFAFASTATGWAMLYLADAGGRVTPLTEGEWEVRGAQLSPDGGRWYLTTSKEHPGEEHLYRMPVRGGDMERLTWGEGMHGAVLSPDGRRIATRYETRRLMPDLYLLDASPGAEPRRITKSGTDDFYRLDLLDSEIITFADPKGLPTWAEIWERPETPNGAAVVYVHGCGECAQGVTKGWRRTSAKLYAKYLHQRGYQSANLDYRGSSGYGHANRTYAYRQMGVSDIDSGLPLLDILARDYGVDSDRIGVYGGSYGGFFTLMALFRRPDRWRAGVALYPVTDWAHYNHGYTSRILNGSPLEDEEAYRVSSPVYYANNYRRGLQIQHGLVDNNVQIQDVFRLSQILMEKDKDFDMAVYPVEAHGWREVPSRRDSYRRMTRWFDQQLLGLGGVAEQGGR